MIYDNILPIVFGGGGLILVVYGLVVWQKIKQTLQWPTVEGEIILSEISRGFKRSHGASYIYISEPLIKYKYKVEDKKYQHNKVALFAVNTASSLDAQRVTDKYPKGAKVIVYYNPQKPQEALLELESSKHMLIIAGVGVVMIIIAPFLWFFC